MKQLIFTVTTILIFVACSKDSGNLGGNPTPNPNDTTNQPPKKCRVETFDTSTTYRDDQDRIVGMTSTGNNRTFQYSGSTLTITEGSISPLTYTATLNSSGYIWYLDNKKEKVVTTATYDANGQVQEIVDKDATGKIILIEQFTFKDGNMIERKELWPNGSSYDTITYTYTYHLDKENKFQMLHYQYEGNTLRKFFIKPSKNILYKEAESNLNNLYVFEYVLNLDGIPLRLKVSKNGFPTYSFLYTFKCK